MQNSVETCGDFLYAPSLGCLCSNPYLHEETQYFCSILVLVEWNPTLQPP